MMNRQQFDSVFPLGSHLCRWPMPAMSELKHDMEILKKQGFNLVKLQEQWAIDEPAEGEYDFSVYEELIEHAAGLDMGVYLGMTCTQAPHWLYDKHPGCRMVGRDGQTIVYESPTTLPADGKPGPCYDHPGAMAEQLEFIAMLVKTLGRYENIVVWNTWQEIGYWSESQVGNAVCFCPNTLNFFRRWLEQKYGDLDSLNRAWRTRYAAWEMIIHSRTCNIREPQAVDINWQYFMDNIQVANVLRQRADAIKAADPLDRPVFAHKGAPAYGSGQDWAYARSQDFLGASCYPAWECGQGKDDGYVRPFKPELALLNEMWDRVAYQYDHIRSASPGKGRPGGVPVWAAEFQGGPVSTGFQMGRVPSAADIRRWMLTAVSAGVTAISFWVTRAEIMAGEQNGFGLLDSTGDTTARLKEAGCIGRALNDYPELFAQPTLETASVAIMVNEDNFQLCRHLKQGDDNLAYSTRGWYRLIWDMSIPIDLIDATYDINSLADYPLLILPFPLSISKTTAKKLVQYVEAGGCLICEAAPGRIDENGICSRGEISPILSDLFGVAQKSFDMVREPDNGSRWSPPERTWGEYLDAQMLDGQGPLAGHRLRANVYVETFELSENTEPVLMAGERVAGTRRRVGNGQAWLIGTYVGHNGTAYRDSEIHKAVQTMLATCGVLPEYAGKLLVRKRVVPGKEAWIFTNPTSERITERVSTSGWRKVSDLLEQTVTITNASAELTVEPFDIRVLVVEK